MTLNIGDNFQKKFIINDKLITEFANITGDINPIHLEEEFASKSVFRKRIAHGMLLGGLISSILGNDFPGIGTIYLSQTMKFTSPVFIDDEVTITLKIETIENKHFVTIRTDCFNQNNMLVLTGEAIIIPPK